MLFKGPLCCGISAPLSLSFFLISGDGVGVTPQFLQAFIQALLFAGKIRCGYREVDLGTSFSCL